MEYTGILESGFSYRTWLKLKSRCVDIELISSALMPSTRNKKGKLDTLHGNIKGRFRNARLYRSSFVYAVVDG